MKLSIVLFCAKGIKKRLKRGREDLTKKCTKMGLGCVRTRVRKTFQNMLKLEKIRKRLKNYIKQFQSLLII